ncbi:hypothetical protein EWM60_19885 [Candidatus Erwinia dacicola]|nr:hypothetical protein [Candidatus Erwinia dacicola]
MLRELRAIIKVFATMSLNASTTLFARLFASLRIMTCFVALSTVVSRNDFWSLPKMVSISKWLGFCWE